MRGIDANSDNFERVLRVDGAEITEVLENRGTFLSVHFIVRWIAVGMAREWIAVHLQADPLPLAGELSRGSGLGVNGEKNHRQGLARSNVNCRPCVTAHVSTE
eukprot:Selendium_serpulae@DN8490_c0_g1_i1.p1